jgi:hypothetical protein
LFQLDVAYEAENIPRKVPKRPRQAALKSANRGNGQNQNLRLFASGNVEQRRCMSSRHGKRLSKLRKIGLAGCQRKSANLLSRKKKSRQLSNCKKAKGK